MNTDDVYHDPWASPGSNPNRPLWSPGQPSSVAETSTADNSQIIDDTADTSINAGGSHYESEHVNSPSAPIQSPRRGREPATPSTPGQGAANVKKTQQERRPVPPKSTEPEMSITATVVALKRPERTKPLIQFNVYTKIGDREKIYYDVTRTRDEFVKFHNHLVSSTPQAIVPIVPPAATSAGVGTAEDELRMKAAFQRWLNLVFQHRALQKDREIMSFIESNYGYDPIQGVQGPTSGMARMIRKQMATPTDASNLHPYRAVVKKFFAASKTTHQCLGGLVKRRRALGSCENALGTCMLSLADKESHHGLARAFSILGNAVRKVGDIHARQATSELTYLGDSILYHCDDARNCKATLTNREFLLSDLARAEKSREEAKSKAEAIGSATVVSQNNAKYAVRSHWEMAEAETRLRNQVSVVTAGLERDLQAWLDRTASELRAAMVEYADRQVQIERTVLSHLEDVRIPVRAIDGTGGLSRLGREGHPIQIRPVVTSSQGPKGDAWSCLPNVPASDHKPVGASAFTSPRIDHRSGSGSGAGAGTGPARDGTDVVSGSEHGRADAGAGTAGGSAGALATDDDRLDARNAASVLGTNIS